MKGLFVDTSAWVALRDGSDGNHEKAVKAWQRISTTRIPLTSSLAVLSESLTLLRRRTTHKAAVEFGEAFLTSAGLVRASEDVELHQQAWDLFKQRQELVLSYVDCLSFAIMRRRGLRQAFAFDADFKAMGFLLFPESPLQ